ncbi:hypothetical protein F4604DRAFT_1956998 [Suillus subluteus]|nr:hypothetical protein F4604DRAFT_1956998 [Suillus subluteus]
MPDEEEIAPVKGSFPSLIVPSLEGRNLKESREQKRENLEQVKMQHSCALWPYYVGGHELVRREHEPTLRLFAHVVVLWCYIGALNPSIILTVAAAFTQSLANYIEVIDQQPPHKKPETALEATGFKG